LQESFENLAIKIIDKSNHYPILSKYVLTHALDILIPVEKEKVVQHLIEHFIDLLEDKEGVVLGLKVINYANPKQKKVFLNSNP